MTLTLTFSMRYTRVREVENAGFESVSDSESLSGNPHEKPQSGVVAGPDAPTLPIPLPPENHPKPTDLANVSASGVPEDPALAAVIAAWHGLSSEVRQCILAIVHGRSTS